MKRLLLTITATLLALSACAVGSGQRSPSVRPSLTSQSPASPDAGASSHASDAAASDLDRAFIDMMVPHHQSAIEMAKIALDRAQHGELKTLAQTVIGAQQGEIDDMKDWRLEWFGSDVTPPMEAMPIMPGVDIPGMNPDPSAMPGMSHMPGMGGASAGPGTTAGITMDMTVDIDALRTAEPFDRAFLETMIRHHESAIAAAEVILEQTEQPELRTLAQNIISSQQSEIDQMRTWLGEWYPPAS